MAALRIQIHHPKHMTSRYLKTNYHSISCSMQQQPPQNNIKVVINGAAKEIGMAAVLAVTKARGMEVAGAVDSYLVGEDIGKVCGMEEALEMPIINDLTMVLGSISQSKATSVVVDFTDPSTVYDNVKQATAFGMNSVVYVPRIKPETVAALSAFCEKASMGCLVAPTLSIGSILLQQAAISASFHYKNVEIVESKANIGTFPSQDAVQIANNLTNLGQLYNKDDLATDNPARGQRLGEDGVRVHSLVLPGLVSSTTVHFSGPGEMYSIKHDITNVECLMPGLILAIRQVVRLKVLGEECKALALNKLDNYLDSSQQAALARMGPNRTGVGMVHSSSSSGIFFQGDGQSQGLGSSHMGSFGNSNIRSNIVPVSGDGTNTSSLVTDASGGGPRLQRSASANNDSYMRLPNSPLSFTSNNISISGSSVIDGPGPGQAAMQPGCSQEQNLQRVGQVSMETSLPLPRVGQVSVPNGSRGLESFMQENDGMSHLQKKPRLDIKQEDVMQQQVLQQMLQRQDSMQMQGPNPQLQTLIQQQRLRQQQQQQQQLLQSLPPVQRAHLLQQQQQMQLRQQLQQQSLQGAATAKRPYDGGVCSRRLMQHLYHQRQRPADNGISYWRKFVAEYYSPRAKIRWCLSLYDNVGHHSLGVFPQAAMDAWQCDICGSKSGRGFEATFEVLPRLNEIKFGSGVIDELLFLDLPREYRFPSGIMVLEYGQAVQESIYEQLRVVREGQLKVIFTPDLKILSWEFCARRHEELLPRRLVAPQVNQLLQVAQKCQSTIAESGSEGVSQQDLQTNSNMVVTAGRQLARSLELQSLNDLGFSKRYVRCLQISEVVNSMKDLMDFCRDTKAGPIEGLKTFPRQTSSAKSQMQKMQEMEQMSSIPGLPADRNTLNKLVSMNPGLTSPLNNNSHLMGVGRGAPLNGSPHAALALSNYQNMLMRQNSMNSNSQQEASSSFNNSNQNGYPFQGSISGLSNSHLLQQRPMFQAQQNQQQGGNQAMQQHMIQQLLQDMSNGGGGSSAPKPSISGQSAASGSMGGREGLRYGISSSGTSPRPPAVPTRSNSFKGASRSDSSAGGGANNIGVGNQKATTTDLPQLCDDIVGDIASEFTGNGFFDNDELESYNWKA